MTRASLTSWDLTLVFFRLMVRDQTLCKRVLQSRPASEHQTSCEKTGQRRQLLKSIFLVGTSRVLIVALRCVRLRSPPSDRVCSLHPRMSDFILGFQTSSSDVRLHHRMSDSILGCQTPSSDVRLHPRMSDSILGCPVEAKDSTREEKIPKRVGGR